MSTLFRPHERITARVDAIGAERAPVLIIDNFVADPERLVNEAVQGFEAAARVRSSFPGIVTIAPDAFSLAALSFLLPALKRVFGVSGRLESGGCDFQLMTLAAEDRSLAQRLPHFDVPNLKVLASVHYLCPPGFSGTAFYRHNSTGFEVISPDRAKTYNHKVRQEVMMGTGVDYINSDSEVFTRIAAYEAVYNRLIFFSAACLHSGLSPVQPITATSPETGRLTANMFLKFWP
jgi:hypothetical protein